MTDLTLTAVADLEMSPRQLPESEIFERTAPFEIHLDIFSGPLHLLLHLIHKNKIDIFNIPMAQITQEYLTYMTLMKELNIEIVGEYLYMAATLLFIKSKMLLPESDESELADLSEGEFPERDPRRELALHLYQLQQFRELSDSLYNRELLYRDLYIRETGDPAPKEAQNEPAYDLVSLFKLVEAYLGVLKQKALFKPHKVVRESHSIPDKIQKLMGQLPLRQEVNLFALCQESRCRIEIILIFLALLEMAKLNLIRLIFQEEQLYILRVAEQLPAFYLETEAADHGN